MTSDLEFGSVTHVMAVINMSPESRNSGSVAGTLDEAMTMAERYRALGATVIDIGGQSSHYENPTIEVELEIDRLAPVVEKLVIDGHCVSVDTWKPDVAAVMVGLGAAIVNDTGGLADPEMVEVVADSGAIAVVMYIEGTNPHDVGEVELMAGKATVSAERLRGRVAELEAKGVRDLIIDPGIAINYRGDYEAYTRMQLDVIRHLDEFKDLGPVLIPIPRKQEDHRVAAYISMALEHQADLIRVHDVEMACDLVALYDRTAPIPG